jgi:hypothetical protein
VTERQWHECGDPEKLLEHLKDKASDRKLRLFAVACCQHISRLIVEPASRPAVTAAEKLAEGETTEAKIWLVRDTADLAAGDEQAKGSYESRGAALFALDPVAYEAAKECAAAAVKAVFWSDDDMPEKTRANRQNAEQTAQVALVRDIFGNPFRSVVLDRSWLTSDVLALARGIYKSRAFDRMPILADALQDGGCNNDDVLNHCRDATQLHVRGCWVVDLLLGKV